jgi:hypothetical protein
MRQLIRILLLSATAISLCIAAGDDEEKSLKVDSVPSGAHVLINGRERGQTPFAMKMGRWAFDTRKSTIFSKHLSEPLVLEISLEGYRTESLRVTRGPFVWRSLNGQNAYSYWVVNSPSYVVRLRPVTRVLTNADVVQLLKSGLSEALVIDKLQTSACEFKTDPEDLTALQASNVPEVVIAAMLHAVPLDPAGAATTIHPVKR